jgi:hypothetical protein
MDHLFCHDCKAKCLKMYELFHHLFHLLSLFLFCCWWPEEPFRPFPQDGYAPTADRPFTRLAFHKNGSHHLSWVKFKIVSEVF